MKRLLVLSFCFSVPAFAEDAAFVEASSELDDGNGAYNAVDGKDGTAWCSSKTDGTSAALSFGFDRDVTVTHIGLMAGALKGDAEKTLDKTKKRARIVYVADVEHRVEAKFRDDGVMQELELSPPAKGKRIVVEFAGVYDGAAGAPLCISEIHLKSGGNVMTGSGLFTKYKGMNGGSKKLLHEWLDDVSAPTRTLLFNLDGTFTYRFEPLLEGKPAKVRGKWTAGDRSVTLDVGGKQYRMEKRVTQVDDGDVHTSELVLSGEAPHSSMAATFRPAPARLP